MLAAEALLSSHFILSSCPIFSSFSSPLAIYVNGLSEIYRRIAWW